jgi:hypothetical protein
MNAKTRHEMSRPEFGRFVTSHSYIIGDWWQFPAFEAKVSNEYTYIKTRFYLELQLKNGQLIRIKFKPAIRSH